MAVGSTAVFGAPSPRDSFQAMLRDICRQKRTGKLDYIDRYYREKAARKEALQLKMWGRHGYSVFLKENFSRFKMHLLSAVKSRKTVQLTVLWTYNRTIISCEKLICRYQDETRPVVTDIQLVWESDAVGTVLESVTNKYSHHRLNALRRRLKTWIGKIKRVRKDTFQAAFWLMKD